MSRTKGKIISLIFLFCQLVYSQDEKESKTLSALIHQLEQQFNVDFSYADRSIEAVEITIPAELNTLEEIIDFLQDNTQLSFSILENDVIAISAKKSKITICGYFMDIDTGEPIENVTIQASNNATSTNNDGFFSLEDVPITDLVVIKHISYKTVRYVTDRFEENDCASIYLVANIERIQEIVIRNYLTKGIRKTTTGSYDIDYSNFGILPGLIEHDVLQTIQALPGVQSVDETVSNINIRGGGHDEILMLWDGIKMYQSGHFFGLISAFNPFLTKSAVLVKNGTNAGFSDGVSGTILMHTEKELTPDFRTELGLNMIYADALVDIPIGNKSSVQLSARKSINELWKTPTYKQYFDKAFQNTEVVNGSENVINSDDDFSFYDLNLRWLYHVTEFDKIRVNLLGFSNNLDFLENAIVDGVEESKESNASQDNMAASIYYERIWNEEFATELQIYTTKYLLKSTNFDILNNQRLIQQNEVIEESIKLDTKYNLSKNLILYNGYQYLETGVTNIQDVDNPLFYYKSKEVIRSHGLSGELGFQSLDRKMNVRGGIRLNYIEKFGTFHVEPRISFSHKFLQDFTVEILGEMKHQTTTQIVDFQEDFLGIENRRWILSNNEEIPVVKSNQASLGLNFNKKGWLVSVEGYYKFVDGITTQSQGFQNQYQYVKTDGSYTVIGADFLINKRFKKISTWLSYSYMDNQYEFEELEDTSFANNLEIKHAVTFAGSYQFKKFKVSGGLNWHTGKPNTEPVEGNEIVDGEINYESANSSRLDSYTRFDMSSEYSFKMGKKARATAGISVWNLFNQENIINKYYRITDDGTIDEVVEASLGVTPNVSFRVAF